MNRYVAPFPVALATFVLAVSSGSAFALEVTASGHDATAIDAFSNRIDTMQALLAASINELTRRVDTCTALGKLYGPNNPSKDASGCVAIDSSSTVPDATTCDSGQPAVSDGSKWVCPKTYANPKCATSWSCLYHPATAAKFCQLMGKTAVASSPASLTSGPGNCNSCGYTHWTGAAWAFNMNCNSCRPIASITCY